MSETEWKKVRSCKCVKGKVIDLRFIGEIKRSSCNLHEWCSIETFTVSTRRVQIRKSRSEKLSLFLTVNFHGISQPWKWLCSYFGAAFAYFPKSTISYKSSFIITSTFANHMHFKNKFYLQKKSLNFSVWKISTYVFPISFIELWKISISTLCPPTGFKTAEKW